MDTSFLAYLLVTSAFSTTIFVVTIPLLVGNPLNLPTKIYITNITVALFIALMTFLFVILKQGNLFFEDNNFFLKIYHILTGNLTALLLYSLPLFLRATRKKISKTLWTVLFIIAFNHIFIIWFAISQINASSYILTHTNLYDLRQATDFLFPVLWLLYESKKIIAIRNGLILRSIFSLSILGLILGVVLLLLITYTIQNFDNYLLNKQFIYNQVLIYRIFRGSWYCLFEIFICFYWVSLYSNYAVTQQSQLQKLNILLTEKDELIRNLSNKNILIETGGLSVGLAHEVNQFLTRIELNSDEVLEKLKCKITNPEELKPAIENILSANHSAANLIISLKKLFKGSGEDFVATDMDRLILDVVSLYQERANRSKIKISMSLNANQPFQAWDTLIRQAIANLISNAMDALESVNRLDKKIEINTTINNLGQFYFSITDNGQGIDQSKAKNLFNLFYSSKISGIGIGLWLTNYIIERHNGKLKFRNLPNHEGTKFVILIPVTN